MGSSIRSHEVLPVPLAKRLAYRWSSRNDQRSRRGCNPSWTIPAGSPYEGFKIAEVATATATQSGGDYFHRPLVRPFADSDCVREQIICASGVTTSNPGKLTAVIERLDNDTAGNRLYKIDLTLSEVRPGVFVKFQILQPTPIVLDKSIDVFEPATQFGTVSVTMIAKNPSGVFVAQAIDKATTPNVLGTVEVK
jgi:hypothetical protein